MDGDNRTLAMRLFALSPLKQEKFRRLTAYIGDSSNKRCLDLGSDNGVISFMLRQRGGDWSSADLTDETVEAIKAVVAEQVYKTDGKVLPFADNSFDIVAIVDLLEHVHTATDLIEEAQRILKPAGTLIINVPNPKPGLLRKLRFALGQTDEAHGHVRAGYNILELHGLLHGLSQRLSQRRFILEHYTSYSRVFSELVDTFITLGIDLLKGKKTGAKGRVTHSSDLKRQGKQIFIYSLLYPFLKLACLLDRCLPFLRGNMLIVRAIAVK